MDFKNIVRQGKELSSRVRKSQRARKAVAVARVVAESGPVMEVARLCGRAGVAGAVVDGSMGGMAAFKAMREGKIDGKGLAKHMAAEAGCGFVTSASGTAGTVAVYLVTGTMGPAALVMGMGASMGSRWAYRKVVGETLPGTEQKVDTKESAPDTEGGFEEIGPRPSSSQDSEE